MAPRLPAAALDWEDAATDEERADTVPAPPPPVDHELLDTELADLPDAAFLT